MNYLQPAIQRETVLLRISTSVYIPTQCSVARDGMCVTNCYLAVLLTSSQHFLPLVSYYESRAHSHRSRPPRCNQNSFTLLTNCTAAQMFISAGAWEVILIDATAVLLKNEVFWDVTMCCWANSAKRLELCIQRHSVTSLKISNLNVFHVSLIMLLRKMA